MQQVDYFTGRHRYHVRWEFGDEMAVEQAVNEWVRRGLISWFDALILVSQVFKRLEIP